MEKEMYFPTNMYKAQSMYVQCTQCINNPRTNKNPMVKLDFHAQLLHLKKVHGIKAINLDTLEFIY